MKFSRTKEEWLKHGNTLLQQNKLDKALHAYHQALRLDPNYGKVYNNIGLIHNTRQAYEEALRLDPNDVGVRINMATTLEHLARFEEALQACQEAVHLDANDVNAHMKLGISSLGLHVIVACSFSGNDNCC